MTNIKLKKTENKNANKELFDRINKIKKRVRMFIEGNNENEWQNAQSFQLTNLIKLLIAKKKEMTFPFKSKQGNETNDKITITNEKNQEGVYVDTKRNVTHKFIYITLLKHAEKNIKPSKKPSNKSPKKSPKKSSNKSPRKSSKKSPKKSSKKSPRASSKRSPRTK